MWKNISILNNQIKHDTGKASLIKLPGSANLVWVSNKCIHDNNRSSMINVGINTDFSYHAVRGKTVKFEISGEEILEYFENEVIPTPQSKVTFIENKPRHIEPKDVDVDDSLFR